MRSARALHDRWRRSAVALVLGCACGLAGATDGVPWFDGDRPGSQAQQAVELLGAAASHGLDPQDYDADALKQGVIRAAQGAPPEPAARQQLEKALTASMHRYLGDLHQGRIDPRSLHQRFSPPRRDAFDAPAVLQAALAARRLPEAVREAAPRVPLYERLREALARYRDLAGHPAWQQPLPPLPGAQRGRPAKLEPGQDYAGTMRLAERLAALGDLPPGMPVTSRYDGPLVDALRGFQQRHGLVVDGVIGAATLAQLQVTPATRVRQIELMLERLRWTPLLQAPRMIVVNIPEFVLRAYEVGEGGRISVRQEMKVIVGKALDTRTPQFDAEMRHIEFSPYWNVPPSIARNETVPRLRRDPGYLEREGFEFVAAGGGVVTQWSAASLDAVLAGHLRLRQRPGPRNALGDIKFVFPNQDNIYLHHTPATALFERERRDFSHGCIRVEQPEALAAFVLQDQPAWTPERIRQAMGAEKSTTLRLSAPVPVLIAYGTTVVKGGRIHFFDDLYGHDRLLDNALRQRQR